VASDAPTPLLALEGLNVAYGGIQAVKGVDLVVGRGELVCLIGANGAGKTTTLKGITGLQAVRSGRVVYDGADITGRPSFELVQRGLAMVPEGRGVFGGLTIEENLAMGAYTRNDRAGILWKAFELMVGRADELATLMTLEMGKPVAESKAEILYAADFFRWYSGEALRIDGNYKQFANGTSRVLVVRAATVDRPMRLNGPCSTQ
jgi:ABC-type branched-subunit amino acid transport system ATPase component